MTPERWQQVKQLFAEAQRREGEERSSYLEAACGSDRSLFDEVASLLSAQADPVATEALRPPFATGSSASTAFPDQTQSRRGMDGPLRFNERIGAASPAADIAIGRRIGRYRITGLLGRGGMGAVYEAEQDEPRRTVALKVVRGGTFVDEHVARLFRREAQALAMLNHPNIATLYEAGHTDEGEHYFVMERVHGIPLDQYVREARPPIRDCMTLFAQICEAIAYAHQRGIIHRDLKPGNVLVVDDETSKRRNIETSKSNVGEAANRAATVRERTAPERQGPPDVRVPLPYGRGSDRHAMPKILDFGLAKITESDVSVSTMTAGMQRIEGTLAYMSPEQTRGRLEEIDVRSDIYSLGVLMYELLAGRPPYNVRSIPLPMAIRAICEEEPPRPSETTTCGTGVPPVASGHGRPPRDLQGDIDTIVLKCLQKDPSRRYQGAADLARDIRHYLAGEPIEARRDSFSYVLKKQLWRYRFPVGVAAGFVLLLTAGLIVSLTLYGQAVRQRDRAVLAEAEQARERKRADQEANEAKRQAQLADVARKEAEKRESETEQVAKFQEEQLSGIDAQTMGVRLRADLLKKARAAAERTKAPPEEVDARIEELEKLIAGSDFTGLALVTLDENVFQRALAAVEKQFGDQPVVKARLFQTAANTLQELGLLDAATKPQEEALEIRRRVLGDEHPATLDSINNVGILLLSQGKLAEADGYFREALEKQRRVLGDAHPQTLSSINNLGGLLQKQGKLEEAEAYCREALQKRRHVLGDEHPSTLSSAKNMGELLLAQGKLEEAEAYCREALEKRRRVLGDERPETITSISEMGTVLTAQGKLRQAETYRREALDKCRRVLGDEHPNTLTSISNLGSLLQDQGKLEEAEAYCREALEKRRRVLGDEHADTLDSINNMGVLLHAQGKPAAAEDYCRQALESQRHVLGDDHPKTLNSINNMGPLLREQGKLEEAEPYYREALERRRRVLGDEHPDTLSSINNLGFLLNAQGKLAEAEPYCREALEKFRRVLGDEHSSTLVSISNLGDLLRSQGKTKEAVALLAPAEPAVRRVFTGANALRLGRFLTVLGRSRGAGGEFDTSRANLKEAYVILSEAKSATQKHRAEVLTGLMELYDAWHAAEPDEGHDVKAAEWRAKLAAWQATTELASTQPAALRSRQ